MASATATGAVHRPMMAGGVGSPVLHNLPPQLSGTNKGGKPVPMKLFATWEVERTPPNCIPRLCSLTLARLVLYKSLDSELNSIVIAVKMQSCKRTLRSNEIPLPSTGLLDTELELTFCLQYPHFLKREGNTLQIMLQRRKKYKNRTILGYKTLGTGLINMSHVLQREMEQELELVDNKGGGGVLGKVYMQSLTSQPVDHEEPGKQMVIGDQDREGLYSEDEEDYTSPEEGSDSGSMLDDVSSSRRKSSKGLLNSAARQRNIRQKFVALLRRFKVNEPDELTCPAEGSGPQRSQIEDEEIQDLINQLDDLSDSGPEVDTMSVGSTPKPQLRPFFGSSRSSIRDALDGQNPAPPRNNKGYSLLEKTDILSDRMSDDSSGKGVSDSQGEVATDHEHSDTPAQGGQGASPPQSGDEKIKDRRSKLFSIKHPKSLQPSAIAASKDKSDRLNCTTLDSASPRKVLLEQLSRMLPQDDTLPEQIILANTGDPQASHLASKLTENGLKVICTACSADVRATLTCLVTRIQKFCNTNINPPNVLKVGLIGSDAFINSMLRPYVELFTSKPVDWQNLFRFFVIPLGQNSISKGLGARCPVYSRLFQDESWRDLLEKAEPSKHDVAELVSRVYQYLNSGYTTHLKIAEAVVTYKEKSSEEDSEYLVVPFVSDVRVGQPNSELTTTTASNNSNVNAAETEDQTTCSGGGHHPLGGGSERGGGRGSDGGGSVLDRSRGGGSSGANAMDKVTPPSSPSISKYSFELGAGVGSKTGSSGEDCVELQLDYWTSDNLGDQAATTRKSESEKSKKQDSKLSIKNCFRSLVISNLAAQDSPDFVMKYTTKEKRPKAVLKLGKKKEKAPDSDAKVQSIEGINRLICSTVKSSHLIKVYIDGQEWTGVKFFQLSSHWQTHTKQFPVAVASEPNLDL